MQYAEYIFQLDGEEFAQDLFEQTLADFGFESFIKEAEFSTSPIETKAYIPVKNLNENDLQQLVDEFPYAKVSILSHTLCEDKDWNTEWEKHYYEPIIIGNELVIHSTFHKDVPVCKYDIAINPKMAFGTGHHQTTSQVLEELLHLDLQGLTVLDMGCGTGILAMLAALRGASYITAIDIDDWCVDNAKENISLNFQGEAVSRRLQGSEVFNFAQIEVLLGDANLLKDKHFDIILANINRNILLNDMPAYVQALNPNGTILMSGFYQEDIPILVEKAKSLGLTFSHSTHKDNWAMIALRK